MRKVLRYDVINIELYIHNFPKGFQICQRFTGLLHKHKFSSIWTGILSHGHHVIIIVKLHNMSQVPFRTIYQK